MVTNKMNKMDKGKYTVEELKAISKKAKARAAKQGGVTEKRITNHKTKGKTTTTRRSHSRGNLWSHQNEKQRADIDIWYKVVRK